MRRARAAIGLVVLVLVAACSSSESGHGAIRSLSTSSATSTTSASSSTASAPATSASSASSTSSSRSGSVPACGDNAFDISNTAADSATGHSTFVVLFKNKLTHACTVFGYPGLDAISSAGAVLAHASRTLTGFAGGASSVRTITVSPGGMASARVEWTNFNTATGGDCAVADHVLVTPANTADTVRLPVSVTACSLQVHPTVAGTSGNAP